MVDSKGDRRRISRRTVRPPTPESKTPMGLGSDTASASHRSVDRGAADKRLGNASDVPTDRRVRARNDKGHAFVVGLDDQPAVGDNLKVGPSAQRPGQFVVTYATTRIGPVHQVLHLLRRVADGVEN